MPLLALEDVFEVGRELVDEIRNKVETKRQVTKPYAVPADGVATRVPGHLGKRPAIISDDIGNGRANLAFVVIGDETKASACPVRLKMPFLALRT